MITQLNNSTRNIHYSFKLASTENRAAYNKQESTAGIVNSRAQALYYSYP